MYTACSETPVAGASKHAGAKPGGIASFFGGSSPKPASLSPEPPKKTVETVVIDTSEAVRSRNNNFCAVTVGNTELNLFFSALDAHRHRGCSREVSCKDILHISKEIRPAEGENFACEG
jgi:hypothetical protein